MHVYMSYADACACIHMQTHTCFYFAMKLAALPDGELPKTITRQLLHTAGPVESKLHVRECCTGLQNSTFQRKDSVQQKLLVLLCYHISQRSLRNTSADAELTRIHAPLREWLRRRCRIMSDVPLGINSHRATQRCSCMCMIVCLPCLSGCSSVCMLACMSVCLRVCVCVCVACTASETKRGGGADAERETKRERERERERDDKSGIDSEKDGQMAR